MKTGIHPKYGPAKITCACGNVIETRSTKPDLKVEVCANCHPFYTGKERVLFTTGRIDKFLKRYGLEGEKKETEATQS